MDSALLLLEIKAVCLICSSQNHVDFYLVSQDAWVTTNWLFGGSFSFCPKISKLAVFNYHGHLCFSPSCFKDRYIYPFLVSRDSPDSPSLLKNNDLWVCGHICLYSQVSLGCMSSNSADLNTSISPSLINFSHYLLSFVPLLLPVHFSKFHFDWTSSSQLFTCDLF